MADDKKVKKIKKKKEEDSSGESAVPAAAPAPAPAAAEETPKRPSTRGSRKAQRTGSNVFSVFSQKQVAEFKEAFQMMDADKDGVISKNDLRAAFNAVGKMTNDNELSDMLKEASGPINFTMLLTLFANRMSGSADDDDVIINAFKAFDDKGKIDSEKLKFQLMTFGERFSVDEVEDAFDQMFIDGQGRIDTAKLISMLTAAAEEEEEA